MGSFCANFTTRHTPSNAEFETLELYARLAANAIEMHEHIEQQAHVEQELRQAIVVKDEFLGLVSHELRTLMTVIRGLASVLNRNQNLTGDELTQTFRDLTFESERLHRLIENMLTLARVQAGKGPAVEPISINRFIKACTETLKNELPGVDLDYQALPGDLTVLGIERHVEQVLHNLVENAYKYSARGSPIEIHATDDVDEVKISVADLGIGLRDADSLFEPFYREESAVRVAGGLGLGLAVCRTLVEAQGGRIWAEAREGGGSAFHFTLQSYQVEEVV